MEKYPFYFWQWTTIFCPVFKLKEYIQIWSAFVSVISTFIKKSQTDCETIIFMGDGNILETLLLC